MDQISSDDVFENLMNAYARTFDPHSNFFSPRDSEEYRITMSLNYDGIGASLQQTDDYVQVMNVIEGGPRRRRRHAEDQRPHYRRAAGQRCHGHRCRGLAA